jgi:hypothetical protein
MWSVRPPQDVDPDGQPFADEHTERDAKHRLPEVDGRLLDTHRPDGRRGSGMLRAVQHRTWITHRSLIAAEICHAGSGRAETSVLTVS